MRERKEKKKPVVSTHTSTSEHIQTIKPRKIELDGKKSSKENKKYEKKMYETMRTNVAMVSATSISWLAPLISVVAMACVCVCLC